MSLATDLGIVCVAVHWRQEAARRNAWQALAQKRIELVEKGDATSGQASPICCGSTATAGGQLSLRRLAGLLGT